MYLPRGAFLSLHGLPTDDRTSPSHPFVLSKAKQGEEMWMVPANVLEVVHIYEPRVESTAESLPEFATL